MALPKNDPGKSEQEILDAAEDRLAILGGDPSADKVIPNDEPIPAEDLEEVDEDLEEGDDLDSDDDGGDDSSPEDSDTDDAGTDDNDDDTDEDAGKANDGENDEPQLTDAYYRAAIHGGYDEKEIVEFMKANPSLAIKTFSKMHDQMNSVSQEFANIGRFKKEQANKSNPDDKSDDKPGFKEIDLAKLKEDYPDDALVAVIEQMQSQSKAMFDELGKRPTQAANTDQLVEDQQKLEADRVTHVGDMVDSFFRAPGMDQYAAVYGTLPNEEKSWEGLLPSEKMNRIAVIDQVDELISGAKALGKDMDVNDALDRAHLLITQPVQEKMIRKDIMDKVVKRSKSITLKPNGSSTPAASKSTKAKSAEDIEARAEERLAKVFGHNQ